MEVILSQGQEAPDFSLKDQDSRIIKLSDFRGRKVLLYFYPKADTSGCIAQSCAVRDARQELENFSIDILGISPDSQEDQKKFDLKYSLGFPLLSDTTHEVAEAYGVWGDKIYAFFTGIVRSSFLVDEVGDLAEVWYRVKPEQTVPFTRQAIRKKTAVSK